MNLMIGLSVMVGLLLIILIIINIKRRARHYGENEDHLTFENNHLSSEVFVDEDQNEVVLNHSYVLIVEKEIKDLANVLPLLEEVYERKSTLFIIAENVHEEILGTLAVNRIKETLLAIAVNGPDSKHQRRDLFSTIAKLTGGKLFKKEMQLKNAKLLQLGQAKQIVVTPNYTKISM